MGIIFLILGSVFVGIASLIHFAIFYFESVVWAKPATWKRFGLTSQEDAETVKPMALNQGFYNAFLGLAGFVGVILVAVPGMQQAGLTLMIYATLSKLLAATVLITSNPKLARAAALQGTAPLLAVIFLAVALFVS